VRELLDRCYLIGSLIGLDGLGAARREIFSEND
jgi:hypothetical protein